MPRKYLITILAVAFWVYGIVFTILDSRSRASGETAVSVPTITPDAQTIEKAWTEFMAKICAGHGGVNCSAFNSDFSVVCNDGTTDESLLSIYSVPQCREIIENLTNRQSDLMAQTGCYPPSEITCIDQGSYNNTFQRLSSLGLANSEFGRIELGECRNEINIYQRKNTDYKQCLQENKIAPINLPGDRLALPILKSIFCPMFYGKNASYDSDIDLCVCDAGYLKYNGACQSESSICKIKYGPSFVAQNGNCVQSTQTAAKTPEPPSPVQIKTPPVPSVTLQNSPYPVAGLTIQVSTNLTNLEEQNESQSTSEPPPPIKVPGIFPQNMLKNIINSVVSGIKDIFRIFR